MKVKVKAIDYIYTKWAHAIILLISLSPASIRYSLFDKTKIFHQQNLCGQCNQQFPTKGNPAENRRAVHERMMYPCRYCGKAFTLKGDLVKHKRAVHEGVELPCRQCDKLFSV